MELTKAQAGPYLRALSAGLQALAPHDDYVPLRECVAHLRALDPELSGDVLLPAEVDDGSGLPAFTWLERAKGEQGMAHQGADEDDLSDDQIERARALEPDLADRLEGRRRLHRLLRREPLLPSSRIGAAVRRLQPTVDFALFYDRMLPGGGWMRIRMELSGDGKWSSGLMKLRPDGSTQVAAGLRHLLARHSITPLLALRLQLVDTLGVEVTRVARSFVGPFWFPGLPVAAACPQPLRAGLVLHISTEVLSTDIRHSAHRDPWVPPTIGEDPPPGYGIFRERRFAVTPNILEATRRWSGEQGHDPVIVAMVPR